MAIYSMIHEKWYRTQDDINNDQNNLMHEIEESNKTFHDNCDLNDCQECAP
jgi:hypothetical protein